MPVNSSPDVKSGALVRATSPTTIHSSMPSGTPQAARMAVSAGPVRPSEPMFVAARASEASAASSLSRRGGSSTPASPVTTAALSSSTVASRPMPAALSRCSSARAPRNSGMIPDMSRASTPRLTAAKTSRRV